MVQIPLMNGSDLFSVVSLCKLCFLAFLKTNEDARTKANPNLIKRFISVT